MFLQVQHIQQTFPSPLFHLLCLQMAKQPKKLQTSLPMSPNLHSKSVELNLQQRATTSREGRAARQRTHQGPQTLFTWRSGNPPGISRLRQHSHTNRSVFRCNCKGAPKK